jgi:hypothetical protein
MTARTIQHAPTREALERLLKIAESDTGQSRLVANFLLAWWNARSCGGFDFTDMWSCDTAICRDMVQVIAWVSGNRHYPNNVGYEKQFQALIRDWRPKLVKG